MKEQCQSGRFWGYAPVMISCLGVLLHSKGKEVVDRALAGVYGCSQMGEYI